MKKSNLINKIFYLFLIALCFFFVTCKGASGGSSGDDDDGDYTNPNADATRLPVFSNASGLYPSQFALTITALEGYDIWYSTDGSDPEPNKAGSTKYTAPITVQNRNGQENVLATTANIPKMYMNPSDTNRGTPPAPYLATKDQVKKRR